MVDDVARARKRATAVAAPGSRIGVALGVLLALLMACAAVFLVTPSAFAHDQLLSSDPADGDTLDEMPAAITLTFSGKPLESGSAILITGETGQEVNLTALEAEGETLSAPLPSTLPGGVYDVAWRIVSGDGHPLEGSFSFTVGAPGDGEDAGTVEMPEPDELGPSGSAGEGAGEDSGSGDANAGEGAGAGDETAAGGDSTADTSDDVANVTSGMSPLMAGLAVLGALAVVIVLLVVMRRKLKENDKMESLGYGGKKSGGSGAGDSDSDEKP